MGKTRRKKIVLLCAAVIFLWLSVPCLGPGAGYGWKVGGNLRALLSGAPPAELPDTPSARRLERLAVRTDTGYRHYRREEFGPAWADTDRNGCDTRNDILGRDLKNPVFKAKTHHCVVLSGTLNDPYTGETIEFRRGKNTSQEVQIDHVVALADAWRSGAYRWTARERAEFANDTENLLAVDGPQNVAKGASDISEWVPPNSSFRCAYAKQQILVKSKWKLSVSAAEKRAFGQILRRCP